MLRAQCGEFRIEECRYHTLSAFLARTCGPAALDQASYWPAPARFRGWGRNSMTAVTLSLHEDASVVCKTRRRTWNSLERVEAGNRPSEVRPP